MSHTLKKFTQFSTVLFYERGGVLFLIFALLQLTVCAPRRSSLVSTTTSSDYDFSTEPPELVETFNPTEWISRVALGHQIEIQTLKIATQVKLRYARTRVIIQLNNPSNKELQSDFKVILPDNAFFTIFQLKRGKNPKIYDAEVQTKKRARERFHYVRTKTNGTMVAGYIELSNSNNVDLSTYNLKFTLSPKENIQVFLVYETQLERKSSKYSDKIHVYPVNQLISSLAIGTVEFSVNVEELEDIKSLTCAQETEKYFSNCSSKAKYKRKNGERNPSNMELVWRKENVATKHLADHHFRFIYELKQQNDTSAVVISQNNGNFYFVHLFVPENLPAMRKHIIFLLDVSDSMHGNKLDQLKWSMKEILDDLGTQDFFNIIAFSNNITEWSKFRGDMKKCSFPYPATDEFKDSAVTFIEKKLVAQGSTNIYMGLSRAFNLTQLFSPETNQSCPEMDSIRSLPSVKEQVNPKLPVNVQSMIFFLSDGKATSGVIEPNILLDHFNQLNHNNSEIVTPVQIHTIAYDQFADVEFLRALSSQNGGFTKIIREESASLLELTNFYAEVSSQILSQVQISLQTAAINPNVNMSSSSLQILSSPVTIIKGGEVITTGMLFPPKTNDNQSFHSSHFTWSTEGMGRNGKLTYYNSPVYDCTSLGGSSLGKCVARIDFYLERLQAYQLLKKLLERDKLVEDGYICPKSVNDDFQDLKMERLEKYEDDEGVDDDSSCFNSFKKKATELALRHKFVTPYTSFILTTAQVDNGLNDNGTTTPPSTDEDSDSMEYETYFVNPASHGNFPAEKLILIQSISSPSSKSENLIGAENPKFQTAPRLLVKGEDEFATNFKEIGQLMEQQQIPTVSLLISRNETAAEVVGETGAYHQNDNNSTTTDNNNNNNRTIIIQEQQQQQSKTFATFVRDFANRFAKIVFKSSKLTGDSNS